MSDAKNQQAEPSMEEILASIRRIISEDSDAGKSPPAAPVAAPAVPPPTPAAAPEPPPAPAKAAAPAAAPAEILELTEMVGDDGKVTKVDEKPAAPPAPQASAPAPMETTDGDDLISSQTAVAAIGALAGLQAATKKSEVDVRGAMPIGNGAATLEDIVRTEMRPILKAWLDENLPGLVERLVQKEIKRITRQVDET